MRDWYCRYRVGRDVTRETFQAFTITEALLIAQHALRERGSNADIISIEVAE